MITICSTESPFGSTYRGYEGTEEDRCIGIEDSDQATLQEEAAAWLLRFNIGMYLTTEAKHLDV